MNIIFFGTSNFAVSALKKIAASEHHVLAVVTQPDRKRGRHLKVLAAPVKIEAEELKIPIFQPENISDAGFIGRLKAMNADLFVIVAFGIILKNDILNMPRSYCLNVHGSLLPKYRGAAPVKWAIVNGDKVTGVTIMKVSRQLDAGDILLQEEIEITPGETSVSLERKLADKGADLLLEGIKLIERGKALFKEQNESDATYAPKLTKHDGHIDWKMGTLAMLDRIRGLKPWPGTYTFLDSHVLKIIEAEAVLGEGLSGFKPGEIAAVDDEKGLIVKTGDGAVSITQLQLEGKKRMSARVFLRGHRLETGKKLE